jgi:CubicO group peptidase (beta-lactamase class C family)
MKRIVFLLSLLLTFQVSLAQPDFKKLDAYYEKALKDWNVPGMSIGIVKDGKLIFARGYGVMEVGKPGKPDENTLYSIASNTKAFTSAAIATLVQEKKLGWNDKVRKHLPWFELYDTYVSEETTIRDILSHRVGLGTFSGDIIWYKANFTPEQIVRRVKYLPKQYDFRSGYGYSNVMYVTAGEIITKITGKTYGEYVKEKFLTPLGMSRTVYSLKDLPAKGNFATPHAIINGVNQPIPWVDWENIAAMGGLISSVKDLSNWVIFNMNHGIWVKDTILTKASRNILWTPHNNFVTDQTTRSVSHFRGYALGWNIGDYNGKLRVSHSGGYDGMVSMIQILPDENLAVILLTNGSNSPLSAIPQYTFDRFLGLPEKDWSSESLINNKKNIAADTRIEDRKKARILNTKPSLPVEKYTGIYYSDIYGNIEVNQQGDKLRLTFQYSPGLSATLKHWHYDTWEIIWDEPMAWFSFGTIKFNMDNNLKILGADFDVPNDDIFFEELKPYKVK